MSHPLIAALQSLIGEAHVVSTAEHIQRYTDEPRRRWKRMPLAVARPADTAEVAACVRACVSHRIPVITRGGGTGTVGGASATSNGAELVLSLDRMRSVRELHPVAATLTAQAGVPLDAARAAAHEHDLEVPLWLASGGSATIGGVLATNAGGNTTIRHGNARRMMLGIEAVLADGRVLNLLSGLRKDNSGYSLAELLVGSEGTLGIITAATIALVPRPRQRVTLLCAIPSPAAALELLTRVRAGLGETLSAFELMPRQAMKLSLNQLPTARDPLARPSPWYALLDAETAITGDWLQPAATRLVHDLIEGGTVTNAVAASSEQQADELWALREAISPAQKAIGASIKHDISIPITAIPEMIDDTLAELRARYPGIRPCVFGHVGDGNLHFNLSRPSDWTDEAFMAEESAINQIVFDRVDALNGSIAAEHGIGQLRTDELAQRADPVKLNAMRRIKHALDPDNLLNPGKLVPPESE